MRAYEIAGLMIVASLVAAMAAPIWSPEDGTVLSGEEAAKMLHQCSRATPQNVRGYWKPETSQIADIETRLPALLEAALAKMNVHEVPSEIRQYAGLILGERKIIYVNGIPKIFAEDEVRLAKEVGTPIHDWHTDALGVCDGGSAFFGVEYDPLKKTFTNFAFNGSA